MCTGTCVRTYFRQFVVSLKKIQTVVLFYQEPEPAPGWRFPEPEPSQNRPAPKPCYGHVNSINSVLISKHFCYVQCFGSGFFAWSGSEFFFLSPDLNRQKIRIRKIRIRILENNVQKLKSNQKICLISYLALSTLSFFVRLLQNLIKNILKIPLVF